MNTRKEASELVNNNLNSSILAFFEEISIS